MMIKTVMMMTMVIMMTLLAKSKQQIFCREYYKYQKTTTKRLYLKTDCIVDLDILCYLKMDTPLEGLPRAAQVPNWPD